ncbi:MAG: hypothetical protein AAB822_01475 [Patescibacteria group bacterium]
MKNAVNQEELCGDVAMTLIYFCSKEMDWTLPAEERLFLSAVVSSLVCFAKPSTHFIRLVSCYYDTDDRLNEDGQFFIDCGEYVWVRDIESHLYKALDDLDADIDMPHTICRVIDCVAEVLKLNFKNNQYISVLMTTLAKIKVDGNIFPVEERKNIERVTMSNIRNVSWGAEYLIEYLAKKTVNYLTT